MYYVYNYIKLLKNIDVANIEKQNYVLNLAVHKRSRINRSQINQKTPHYPSDSL